MSADAKSPHSTRNRYRPGLGDVIVIVALGVLLWVTFGPIEHGRRLARRETEARAALERLFLVARESRLIDCLAAIDADAAGIAGLRPFTGFLSGKRAMDFMPVFEDGTYLYRLELLAGAKGALVTATPSQPELRGRVEFRAWDRERADTAPVLGAADRGPDDDVREQRARDRCLALAESAAKHELRTSAATFLAACDRALERVRPALAAWLTPGGYHLACWVIHDGAGSLTIEVYAWPAQLGKTGYSAFRRSRSGLRQSRNMVAPYDAHAWPPAGAALMRQGAKLDARGAYTGVDGNRWLPLKATEG